MTLAVHMEITGNSASATKAAREAQAEIARIGGSTKTAAAEIQRSSTAATGAVVRLQNGFQGLGRGSIQNVAFQVGDFATQVGSGTSAAVALGQQLPQLLGGFGALGAVLGAVVAIGVPLAASFLSAGDEAQTLGDRSDALADSAERLKEALAAAGRSSRDLADDFGANAQAMQQVLAMQAGLAQADFATKMRGQVQAITDAFGDLDGRISESWAAAGWTQMDIVLGNIRAELDASTPAAQGIVAAMAELGNATGPQEQADAMVALAGEMAEAAGGAGNLSGAMLELYRGLLDGATGGYGAAAALAAVGAAAAGVTEDVLRAAAALKALSSTEDSRNVHDRGVQLTYEDRVGIERYQAGLVRAAGRSAAGRGGSGGGGGRGGGGRSSAASEAERGREAVARLISSLQAEIDVMQTADPVQQEMIRLRERMTHATDPQREAVEGLVRAQIAEAAATDAQVARMDNMRDAASGAFAEIRDGLAEGARAGEIFGSVLGSIGDRLLDLAAGGVSDILFGKAGSAGGGILGGVLSNILPFASGGVVDRPTLFGMNGGRVGLMGEAGPEAIMPLSSGMVGARLGGRETRLPLTRLASGNLGVSVTPFARGGVITPGALAVSGASSSAGGGEATRVRVEVALSPDLKARLLEEATGRAEVLVAQSERRYDATLPGKVRSIQRDPSNLGRRGR